MAELTSIVVHFTVVHEDGREGSWWQALDLLGVPTVGDLVDIAPDDDTWFPIPVVARTWHPGGTVTVALQPTGDAKRPRRWRKEQWTSFETWLLNTGWQPLDDG